MAPAPAPARRTSATPRVSTTVRIRADRDTALRRYTEAVGSSRQNVFDQMVDEYLAARGYLPEDEQS